MSTLTPYSFLFYLFSFWKRNNFTNNFIIFDKSKVFVGAWMLPIIQLTIHIKILNLPLGWDLMRRNDKFPPSCTWLEEIQCAFIYTGLYVAKGCVAFIQDIVQERYKLWWKEKEFSVSDVNHRWVFFIQVLLWDKILVTNSSIGPTKFN